MRVGIKNRLEKTDNFSPFWLRSPNMILRLVNDMIYCRSGVTSQHSTTIIAFSNNSYYMTLYIHNPPPPFFRCTFIGHSLPSVAQPSQTQVKSILSHKCEHWPQIHALYIYRFELTTELSNLNIVETWSHDSYIWLWLTHPTKSLQLTQIPVLQSYMYMYMWLIQFKHNIM